MEREGAPEPEHDALRDSIDRATDELSELLRDPEKNADAIVAKKKELADLSAQLPPDSMEAVAQGLVEEGGHIVKEEEAATRLDMQEQLNEILAAVEKGEQLASDTQEQTGELSEAETELRDEYMQTLIGEATAFKATLISAIEELEGLDASSRLKLMSKMTGICTTALGRYRACLKTGDDSSMIPTGAFKNDAVVTPEMMQEFVQDVQGGTVLLERVRATIAEQKQR